MIAGKKRVKIGRARSPGRRRTSETVEPVLLDRGPVGITFGSEDAEETLLIAIAGESLENSAFWIELALYVATYVCNT